ncbi:beta-aspartyl-peptidase [Photobacterium aphoticum]|uniref:Isoaspartyl dipeptidase n=1 Tax=Photobacterium aphoticum TaxID=754436 RepID=A0A0J1GNM6_9GAMM|nr:beta-aspartyl-peptidase [Photobacterium aphoticum]KLV01191.1 isoaspartyl dipeptidase [Photobacterium aphoticum]PSU56120.1 beta-aspartyl-peptidase [Photobacterium aphoticum]GHA49589.1 isoaspartyl dipeptidase [Photobacterium aphoticum]
MFTLLKNADLYSPQPLGKSDILLCQNNILAIAPSLQVSGLKDVNTIDCTGKIVAPGLIDQHVHLIGGGGEAGFASRVPQVTLRKLIEAGTTTAIGVMGTDGISRSPRDLYAKAAALRVEGINTFMHTGSYEVPTKTLTGCIRDDITFLPCVLGVKIALADHRCSFPTTEELSRIVSDIRIAGMLSGKRGVLHIHMGDLADPFAQINELLNMGLPIHHFSPTHVARNEHLFKDTLAFARKGGYMDITSGGSCFETAEQAVRYALEADVNPARITISSDGNGSLPKFNDTGKLVGMAAADVNSNLMMLPKMIDLGIQPEIAIAMMSANVADSLGIKKGRLHEGADADLCIFNDDFTLDSVIVNGRTMMLHGEVLVQGNYE